MTSEFLGAIDIGGTKTSLAVGTREGEILAQQTYRTERGVAPEVILENAVLTLERRSQEKSGKLVAIGASCPGPIDFDRGAFLNPPNLPSSWSGFPVLSFIQEKSGVPVLIENDANAAVVGEHLYGAGRGLSDLVYLTISTGIGGGIISGNQLVHRRSEPGHVTVKIDGDVCGCGARGCLEAMCSGTAIARRARRQLQTGTVSAMTQMTGNIEDVTAEIVVAAVKDQDELAGAVWQETIELMSIGIGSIIATVAPQAVILGGGVAAGAGQLLLEPLRNALRTRMRIIPAEDVQILLAGLGKDSALYGALALAGQLALSVEKQS